MNPLVDIIIPTYDRAEKLVSCIKSIYDSDYPYWKITVLNDHSKLYGPGLIRQYLPNVTADAVLFLSDDMVIDRQCLSYLVNCLVKNFPDLDGTVAFNQYNLPIPEPWMIAFIGSKFLKRFPKNQCLCPEYYGFFSDTELQEYAISVKRFRVCLNARVVHHHPCFEPAQIDNTHTRFRSIWGYDCAIRKKRQSKKLLWGKDFKILYPNALKIYAKTRKMPDGLEPALSALHSLIKSVKPFICPIPTKEVTPKTLPEHIPFNNGYWKLHK